MGALEFYITHLVNPSPIVAPYVVIATAAVLVVGGNLASLAYVAWVALVCSAAASHLDAARCK